MKTAIATIATILLCLCLAVPAGAQNLNVGGQFAYQRSSTLGGQALNLLGGRAEMAYSLPQHVWMVGEFTGTAAEAGGPTQPGEALYTYLYGLRYERAIPKGNKETSISPFIQFLGGGVYGTDGAFPKSGQLVPNANSFAYSLGGGIELQTSPRVAVRLIQADYLFTQLPNQVGTHQNNLRLGVGVVYTLRKKK